MKIDMNVKREEIEKNSKYKICEEKGHFVVDWDEIEIDLGYGKRKFLFQGNCMRCGILVMEDEQTHFQDMQKEKTKRIQYDFGKNKR